MRRIKIIFAVLVAMATMLVASVAPPWHTTGTTTTISTHHFNDFRFHDFDEDFLFFSPFFFGFDNDCPFAGDFEGPVNQFDCFD